MIWGASHTGVLGLFSLTRIMDHFDIAVRAVCWFHTNSMNVMEGPAQAPDLKPVQQMWAGMKNDVPETNRVKWNEMFRGWTRRR